MRVVVQRVSEAGVTIDGCEVARIGQGLLILLGVAEGDDESHARFLASKIAEMRIFQDEAGRMHLSVKDIGGAALVVSQFTLLADCRKGRRPSFTGAAQPEEADRLYRLFADELRGMGLEVGTGEFGAMMDVSSVNSGPVTILLDSHELQSRSGKSQR